MVGISSVVELLAWSLSWAGNVGHSDGNQDVLSSVAPINKPISVTLSTGGQERHYLLAIPADYKKTTKSWPLIIDFHGRDGSPEGQRENSQYYLYDQGKEYFVAYPLGCLGDGNHGGPQETAWEGAPYADKSCDDILFTYDLVKSIQKNYKIDKTRTYASGKSNGGGFVDTLACHQTGDLFAAFAMASAALYTDQFDTSACDGARPRKFIEAHGTADDTIPIDGRNSSTKSYQTPDIAQWFNRWGKRNGCNHPDKEEHFDTASWGINTTFSCNNLLDFNQQYRINNLGHCWPSLITNTDTPDHNGTCRIHTVDFTQQVLNFFARWHN